jgi:hypothetical protein
VATKTRPEAARLANELTRHFGRQPFTATDMAEEIVTSDDPTALIAAIEEALAHAAAAGESGELDDALWGPAPTDAELAAARESARAAVDGALASALGDALNRDEAARQLGITPQAVSKRHAAGALVALTRGRERRFPAWQFHEGAVLPGLRELIAAYPGTPLALTVWATSPAADLDGNAPAEVLARPGGVPRVVEAAHALTAAAW